MRQFKHLICMFAVLLALAPALARAAEAEVFKQVPGNAQLVLVFPNISDLSTKFAKIAGALNIEQPLGDQPLEQFKAILGINNGLNDSGSLAVIFPKLPTPGAGEPDFVLLLPVKDYNAFLGNFGATPGEGATAVAIAGQQGFARKSGDYAVFSKQQSLIDSFKAPAAGESLSGKAGALGGKVLGRGDAFLYLDLAQIAPTLQPMVQMMLGQAKTQVQQAGPQGALAAGMLDLYGSAAQAVLRDAQGLVVGLDASMEGFGLSAALQFKQGSPLANVYGKDPAGELSFNRLPNKPYLIAGSFNTKALPIDEWVKQVTAKLPADFPMAKLVQSSFDVLKVAGDQLQFAIFPPNLGAGGGLINSINVYQTKDPQKFIAENRKLIEQLNNLDLGQGLVYHSQYQANAQQVDGKSVDVAKIKLEAPPALVAQLGPLGGFFTQDQVSYIAQAKDAVVVIQGADPTSLKDIIDAASGAGKLTDKGIGDIRPKLLGSRVAEAYLGVGTVAQFANGFLSLVKPDAVIEVPGDLPPVAGALSADGGAVGISLYVPMAVVQTGKKTIDKLQGKPQSPGTQSAAAAPTTQSKYVTTITDDNFQAQVLKASGPVLVDFWAVWCGPCKTQSPIVEEVAKQYAGKLKVGKLDIDAHPKTTDQYQVEAIPTLLLFKDGVKVAEFVGLTQKDKLEQAINKALQ